jgi:hypothetical protein
MGKRSKRNTDSDAPRNDGKRSSSSAKANRCRCGKEDKLPDGLFGEECMKSYRKLWERS